MSLKSFQILLQPHCHYLSKDPIKALMFSGEESWGSPFPSPWGFLIVPLLPLQATQFPQLLGTKATSSFAFPHMKITALIFFNPIEIQVKNPDISRGQKIHFQSSR